MSEASQQEVRACTSHLKRTRNGHIRNGQNSEWSFLWAAKLSPPGDLKRKPKSPRRGLAFTLTQKQSPRPRAQQSAATTTTRSISSASRTVLKTTYSRDINHAENLTLTLRCQRKPSQKPTGTTNLDFYAHFHTLNEICSIRHTLRHRHHLKTNP